MEMKELIEKNNVLKPIQLGKIIEGKIIGKARSAVFLDLGPAGTGIIYGREFQEAKEEIKNLDAGDTLFAKVVDLDNEDGYIELSLNQASNEMTWGKLKEKKSKSEIVKINISGANKGGLTAEVYGLPAFLPVSQLLPENYPRVHQGDAAEIIKELQKFVGQDMEVKVFDLDPRQGKLILSEKAKEKEKIKEVLKSYNIGDVVEGEITGITDFGVFIKFPLSGTSEDYPPLEGLIHISELDWQLIDNPADIVKVGDRVKAKIISISDNRVSLSLKALKDDPWHDFEKQYKKGDKVEGEVMKFNPYGAFVQINDKIQGLCHISEFGTKEKMEKDLKLGQKYKFEIVSIDSADHRMNLKLK